MGPVGPHKAGCGLLLRGKELRIWTLRRRLRQDGWLVKRVMNCRRKIRQRQNVHQLGEDRPTGIHSSFLMWVRDRERIAGFSNRFKQNYPVSSYSRSA